jgi:uncharacterized membrane protein YgcG
MGLHLHRAILQCVKLIYGYMGFATFMIFFFMTGGIVVDLLQTLNIHVDAFSLAFILYNFSIVGSTCLFFTPAPLLLKQARFGDVCTVCGQSSAPCSSSREHAMQGYLMWTGVVVAYVFTSIPTWTTWVLLVAMALYDLLAVLTPHGPLQMLVSLAMERDEDIPALVYEAREVRRPRRRQVGTAAADAQQAASGDAWPGGHSGRELGAQMDDAPPQPRAAYGSLLEADPGWPAARPTPRSSSGRVAGPVSESMGAGGTGGGAGPTGDADGAAASIGTGGAPSAGGGAAGPRAGFSYPEGSAVLNSDLARLHRPVRRL